MSNLSGTEIIIDTYQNCANTICGILIESNNNICGIIVKTLDGFEYISKNFTKQIPISDNDIDLLIASLKNDIDFKTTRLMMPFVGINKISTPTKRILEELLFYLSYEYIGPDSFFIEYGAGTFVQFGYSAYYYIPNTIVTHSGRPHVDDMLSSALLLALNPNANIIRTRKFNEIKNKEHVLFIDTNHGWYDHHSRNGKSFHNPNMVDGRATLGLLCEDFIYPFFDMFDSEKEYIDELDYVDNYGGNHNNALCRMVKTMTTMASYNSQNFDDDAFFNTAVEFFKYYFISLFDQQVQYKDFYKNLEFRLQHIGTSGILYWPEGEYFYNKVLLPSNVKLLVIHNTDYYIFRYNKKKIAFERKAKEIAAKNSCNLNGNCIVLSGDTNIQITDFCNKLLEGL